MTRTFYTPVTLLPDMSTVEAYCQLLLLANQFRLPSDTEGGDEFLTKVQAYKPHDQLKATLPELFTATDIADVPGGTLLTLIANCVFPQIYANAAKQTGKRFILVTNPGSALTGLLSQNEGFHKQRTSCYLHSFLGTGNFINALSKKKLEQFEAAERSGDAYALAVLLHIHNLLIPILQNMVYFVINAAKKPTRINLFKSLTLCINKLEELLKPHNGVQEATRSKVNELIRIIICGLNTDYDKLIFFQPKALLEETKIAVEKVEVRPRSQSANAKQPVITSSLFGERRRAMSLDQERLERTSSGRTDGEIRMGLLEKIFSDSDALTGKLIKF